MKSPSDGIDRVRAAVGPEKTGRLHAMTAFCEAVAVAYSGGVDSTLLAFLLARVFKKRVQAVLVKSPFLAAREEAAALSVATALALPVQVLPVNLLAADGVRENGPDRCYRCKGALMDAVIQNVGSGWTLVDGSHAGDAEKDRPGRKALVEKGVMSPLALAGWTKEDIRRTARAFGLPNRDKPSQSCLATRIPHGTPLDADLLQRIEAAEDFLQETGCRHVRVRWVSGGARIQVGSTDMPMVKAPAAHARLLARMKQLGFSEIFLDPVPYSAD
uniref:TIGR00268 family protein n=1 Tax=Desulfacinum infernum TaxID=35837 RepID=A0A832EII6_9BACT